MPLKCTRSLTGWRSELEDLNEVDADEDTPDDDPSMDYDPESEEEEDLSSSLSLRRREPLEEWHLRRAHLPPEEVEQAVGVLIDNEWYPRVEAFFDKPDNFTEAGPFPDLDWGACMEDGCCHNANCWMQHGCMCMTADCVFDLARRIHEEAGFDNEQGVERAAQFVSTNLWRRCLKPCCAAARQVEWLTRHAAWRREGYADASAKLAALGKEAVEGVVLSNDPFRVAPSRLDL